VHETANVFILTSICAVKKIWEKIFCRLTDPNFLAYVTGNINLFLRLTWRGKYEANLPRAGFFTKSVIPRVLVHPSDVVLLLFCFQRHWHIFQTAFLLAVTIHCFSYQ
jgi:hypothetical protein